MTVFAPFKIVPDESAWVVNRATGERVGRVTRDCYAHWHAIDLSGRDLGARLYRFIAAQLVWAAFTENEAEQ